MANQTNSMAHTKWMCKYHIVFTPKYRRKVIYNQYKEDIRDIIKILCKYKGVEIIEGHLMPDHIHMLVSIPPKYIISQFMGYLKGKSDQVNDQFIQGVIFDWDKIDKDSYREFDTLKSKKVPQSLEIGLFFCQIFIFIIQ